LTTLSGAEDWSTCQHDLDRVKSTAQDASDSAEELESIGTDLEDKRSQLQDCITYPQGRDRCQSQRREYDHTKQQYEFKKREIQSELGILELGFRSVQLSCGASFLQVFRPVAYHLHKINLGLAAPSRVIKAKCLLRIF
jgi:hypothetical protein